jgi:hypothetical protein
MLPASLVPELAGLSPDGIAVVAVIADTGIDRIEAAVAAVVAAGFPVRQVEVPVAKRGQDPGPGLRALLAADLAGFDVLAEIPLTWGVTGSLDGLAEARRSGVRVAAKFRTGGLAAELYPTAIDLAGVIVACRDRAVPFKLTAGLHRAIRQTDPETGFIHHGFLNVLAACLAAHGGAPAGVVADVLRITDAVPLIEATRASRGVVRPLWTSLGSSALAEPVADLRAFGLV